MNAIDRDGSESTPKLSSKTTIFKSDESQNSSRRSSVAISVKTDAGEYGNDDGLGQKSPTLSSSSSSNTPPESENNTGSVTGSGIPGTQKNQAAFISKLYSMVEDDSIQRLISWSLNGDVFSVFNPNEFSKIVLPQYFKHNNWQSFVRQLNMYGFHKVNDMFHSNPSAEIQAWEFKHPDFRRGDIQALQNIKRKSSRPTQSNVDRKTLVSMNTSGTISSETPSFIPNDYVTAQDDRVGILSRQVIDLEGMFRSLSENYRFIYQELMQSRTKQTSQLRLISNMCGLLNSLCNENDNTESLQRKRKYDVDVIQSELNNLLQLDTLPASVGGPIYYQPNSNSISGPTTNHPPTYPRYDSIPYHPYPIVPTTPHLIPPSQPTSGNFPPSQPLPPPPAPPSQSSHSPYPFRPNSLPQSYITGYRNYPSGSPEKSRNSYPGYYQHNNHSLLPPPPHYGPSRHSTPISNSNSNTTILPQHTPPQHQSSLPLSSSGDNERLKLHNQGIQHETYSRHAPDDTRYYDRYNRDNLTRSESTKKRRMD